MSKKLFFIIPIFIILIGIGIFFNKKLLIPKKTHYHAGFVVFHNNKKVDFSDLKYMFLEPCALNSKREDPPAIIQIQKAHLHDNVGDLIHIERTGATWQDLFTNIHYKIDYTNATGYINGKRVSEFKQQTIRPFDSLVVFIGNNQTTLLSQAVTKDYMIKMAKKSTNCGD